MRHRVEGRTLGREADHRKALLNNLVKSLIINGRITTTHTKALESRKLAERLITYGKKGDVHNQRLIYAVLRNRDLVKKFVSEVVPKFDDRKGGYTRVLKKGFRKGDNAPLSILEWSYYELDEIESSSEKEKKTKE